MLVGDGRVSFRDVARIDDPLAPFVAASVHRGYRPTIADALDAVKLRGATDK